MCAQPAEPAYTPPQKDLTTLGWLKHLKDPAFPYFEYHYHKVLHRFLTDRWYLLQAGHDDVALAEWIKVMKVLELDNKARRDLMLLAQSGLIGRCKANKVLWQIMTNEALDGEYEDLSRKVTSMVYWARRTFERPPREHPDMAWWWWSYYGEPAAWRDRRWSPREVPRGPWRLQMGRGGLPLEPPHCWSYQ